MVALSAYEDTAAAFLSQFPIGSTVTGEGLVKFAQKHKNGLAGDLLIEDPRKRLSSMRRHVNNGAASRNFSEEERFFLAIEDAKRQTFVVRSLADHVMAQADTAVDRSVVGALSPLRRSTKALNDIKVDELSPEQQQELGAQLELLKEVAAPLKTLFADQIISHWSKKLIAAGMTAQQARHVLEAMPTISRAMKLLKYTN
jgi:hypothetical protein